MNRVWIIDFEYSHILDEDENVQKLFNAEKKAAREMLDAANLEIIIQSAIESFKH